MTAGYPQVTLDCYVRATAAGVLVDDISDTLHTCNEGGLLDELTVEFWPDEIRLTDDTEETAVRAHYRQFQAWAESEGVSLEPAFTRRERTTPVSDGSDTVLVLPVLCLAIRIDGELVSVAPHTTGTTPYTVMDALADIQSLPRLKDVDEIPSNHPARSLLRSDSAEDQSTRKTDDKMFTKQ
jgi:hypothetical protein